MFDCYRLAELKQKFFSNVVNKVNVKQEMIFFLFFFVALHTFLIILVNEHAFSLFK